jgi:hypothetical protein
MDRIPPPSEETCLAVIFQESDCLFIENLPPGGSMAALIVSIRSTSNHEGSIHAKPECLATIEMADDAKGWVNHSRSLVPGFTGLSGQTKLLEPRLS